MSQTITPKKAREIREGIGLTQGQFADLLGVHRATVNGIENDTQAPSITLSRLIDAIGKGYRPPARF